MAGAGARTEAGRRLAATASRPAQDALHRLLDAAWPDVAHVHHVFEGLTLSVVDVLLTRRVPVVMTLHDYKTGLPQLPPLHGRTAVPALSGRRLLERAPPPLPRGAGLAGRGRGGRCLLAPHTPPLGASGPVRGAQPLSP